MTKPAAGPRRKGLTRGRDHSPLRSGASHSPTGCAVGWLHSIPGSGRIGNGAARSCERSELIDRAIHLAGPYLAELRNPWLAGLWLSAVIAAVVLLSFLAAGYRSRDVVCLMPSAIIEPLLHFLGYAVLVGGSYPWACHSFTTLTYIFLAALALSVSLEVVQLLVPERGASFVDFSTNVLGALPDLCSAQYMTKEVGASRSAIRAADRSNEPTVGA